MDGVKSMRLPTRVLAVVVAVGCVAGCSASSPAPVTPPVSAAPPATTAASSAEALAGKDALAAYRGMWADFVTAGLTSDWRSPDLGRHAIGVALTNLSRSLYADHYNGIVTKGEPILNPIVRSADPTDDPVKVIVGDCGDSSHWLKYRADDGALTSATSGGRRRITGVVDKQADGSWKVSDYAVEDLGTC